VEGYKSRIPAVLEMMREYLFTYGGTQVTGIFRMAPDQDECRDVKQQINNGTFNGCKDVHCIANLIKVFFRELPVSLYNDMKITEELMHKICNIEEGGLLVMDLLENSVQEPLLSALLWYVMLTCYMLTCHGTLC